MKYDHELQCYINSGGRVNLCGHPARMLPDCCNGGKYAGMMQIDARAAAGIDAITAGDVLAQKARPVADAAFDEAIKLGVLSTKKGAHNYAGDYMYMGHDEASGLSQFKNINTREYLAYEPAQ